jgi:CheY-like chemotaxis protein
MRPSKTSMVGTAVVAHTAAVYTPCSCCSVSGLCDVVPPSQLAAFALAADNNENACLMHRLKTFIVEDSPVIRENLVATLEELGPLHFVGYAEGEAAAVQWLQLAADSVDLVIVDVFLKQGSGLGVLRAFQAEPRARCKVVVLSNYATRDMRQKCLALGADEVFDKSHEIDALLLYCTRLAQTHADDGDDSSGGGNPRGPLN